MKAIVESAVFAFILIYRECPMSFPRTGVLACVVHLGIVAFSLGSHARREPMDPFTCTSASGQYTLRVNPSERYGSGPASYVMRRRGKDVWAATLPFALHCVVVADSGQTAGYAYTDGPDGLGEFRIVILDPQGKTQLEESEKREHSRFVDAAPVPLGAGLVLDEEHDRLVVRVADADINRNSEEWRVYRLSTAKRTDTIRPKDHLNHPSRVRSLVAARPIRGTPLILMNWYTWDGEPGALFTLFDLGGQTVWAEEYPKDYAFAGNSDADRLRDQIWNGAAVLRTDEPRRFEILHVASQRAVTFEIHPPSGARSDWEVSQVSERPARLSLPASQPAMAIDTIDLKPAGTIRLHGDRPVRSPVRDVRQFTFDMAGRIAFVRKDSQAWTIVLVDPATRKVREIPLKVPPIEYGGLEIACLGPDRYVVALRNKTPGLAWWVDVSGRAEPIELPEWLEIKTLAAAGGGFVVLGENKHAGGPIVLAFDGKGEEWWSVGHDYANPRKLFSPASIAVGSDGTVAVLEHVADRIQVYDKEGQYRKTIDLKKILGDKVSYPSDVALSAPDAWWVYDSGADWCFLIAGEAITRQMRPVYADGRRFRPVGGVQVASDGRCWTSDGESLLRLDKDGRVDLVIGDPPDPDRLDEICAATMDRSGRLYAVARRTGAVHVYDREGVRARILRPSATDVAADAWFDSVSVAADGTVWLKPSREDPIRFSADGRCLGRIAVPADYVRDLHFPPAGTQPWAVTLDDIAILDDHGNDTARIERAPDGSWLRSVHGLCFAPSGAAAVVAGGGLWDDDGSRPYLAVYSKVGEPMRVIPLPEEASLITGVAFDGRHVYLPEDKSILVVGVDGPTYRRFSSPMLRGVSRGRYPFISPDERELWLFVAEDRMVYRYMLP